MGHKENFGPIKRWMEVLHGYTSTTLTFDGDRLVALKGISDFFRSLYPDQLRNAESHSRLWSTNMIQQLPWQRIAEEHDQPARVPSTEYAIPSWSPLKDIGRGSETDILLSNPIFLGILMLLNIFLSMDTSHLDKLGRATSWEGCQMHLQSVLVHITPIESYPNQKLRTLQVAHPAGHGNAQTTISWDNTEEQALAASSADHQLQGLTIGGGCRGWDPFGLDFSPFGILLRPSNAQAHSNTSRHTRRWVRCASFRSILFRTHGGLHASQAHMNVIKYVNAFQISRKYGVSWELKNPEDDYRKWLWRKNHLHDPELEDIYIV